MDKTKLVKTERGWPGHCCEDKHIYDSYNCWFRRNTLISCCNLISLKYIIISTLGVYMKDDTPRQIGAGRYYETLIFSGEESGGDIEVNVSCKDILCPCEKTICASSFNNLPHDVNKLADIMHKKNVQWVEENFDECYNQFVDKKKVNMNDCS